MNLPEVLWGALAFLGSLLLTAAAVVGLYLLIRHGARAGVREGGQVELLAEQLERSQAELEQLRKRVAELEAGHRGTGPDNDEPSPTE